MKDTEASRQENERHLIIRMKTLKHPNERHWSIRMKDTVASRSHDARKQLVMITKEATRNNHARKWFTHVCGVPHICVWYGSSRKEATMGWLRLVGSLKLQVSFAKEPYKREYSANETYSFKKPTNRSHHIVMIKVIHTCVWCTSYMCVIWLITQASNESRSR